IKHIQKSSVGEETELETLRQRCDDFDTHLEHHPLWRGQLAFYLQADSLDEMEARTDSLRATFNGSNLSLRFIKNSDQESPLDSFLRWLPMNYHPELDEQFWYCGWVWLEEMLALSPLFG
ncbi:hypothetical protein VII00023_01420, partial [Vibrio ichthyoenteri ATCC 700023]